MKNRKRTLIGAAAAVAALALVGAAVAAGPAPWGSMRGGGMMGGGMMGGGMMNGAGMMQGRAAGGMMGQGTVMQAAATYIGVSVTDLASARHDGKSLAQIAQAHGETAAGLEAAMTTAFKANLDAAVKDGRITSAQATQMLGTFTGRLDTMVNRTATGGGMGLGLGPCMR